MTTPSSQRERIGMSGNVRGVLRSLVFLKFELYLDQQMAQVLSTPWVRHGEPERFRERQRVTDGFSHQFVVLFFL